MASRAKSIAADLELLPKRLRSGKPAVMALWKRFKMSGRVRDFHALCEHYAPLATSIAIALKKRQPATFSEPLDDLVQDGMLGLVVGVRGIPWPCVSPIQLLRMRIDWTIRRQTIDRRWEGRNYNLDRRPVLTARQSLVERYGRMPTPEEVSAELGGKVSNPQFYVDNRVQVLASQTKEAAYAVRRCPDESELSPERVAMNRELVRMISRKLKGEDRKLFRLVMKGLRPFEIGKAVGIPPGTVHRRLNGLLWQLRCQADLAAYLGVEPHREKIPVTEDYQSLSIQNWRPAQLVG
jgi:RNA polymerase sigma factor (sigma-70 family)